MPCPSPSAALAIELSPPGAAPPPGRVRELRELFARTYLRYPYLHEIAAPERWSLVAHEGGRVAGYASFAVEGGYARCAHLIVDERFRGHGLGRRLDHARHAAIAELGLRPYVSCLCEDVASQRLKLELGLTPVNVKLGHQVESFVAPTGAGTALVFSVGPFPVASPAEPWARADERLRRLTVALDEAAGSMPGPPDDDWYVEALAGPRQAAALAADPRFAYAGVELARASETWHHCFQLRTRAYERGLAGSPALVVAPEELERLHPLPPPAAAHPALELRR